MDDSKLVKVSIDKGGYEFEIDPSRLDDIEVFELFSKISVGDTSRILELVNRVIGDGDFANIKRYYIEKYGHMTITKDLTEVVVAIFSKFPKSQA